MKKLLLSVLMISAFSFSAFAQKEVKEIKNVKFKNDRTLDMPSSRFSHPLNKTMGTVSDYYSYPTAIGLQRTSGTYYRSSLFPDSTVYATYGDGQGGVTLSSVWQHSAGIIFDPKSQLFTTPLSQYNPYNVDSVFIRYVYKRWNQNPSIVDTAIVQFYTASAIQKLFWVAQDSPVTATVKYNHTTNTGIGATITKKIPLTAAVPATPG